MGDTYSDDIAERADEIEALSAIFESSMAVNSDDNSVSDIIIFFFIWMKYGDTVCLHLIRKSFHQQVDFTITSSDSDSSNEVATLHVALPPTYPSRSPPSYELSAPFLSSHEKAGTFIKLLRELCKRRSFIR